MVPPQPLLIVTAGVARGRSVPLTGTVSIGRDDENVLAIHDPALSRRHCTVTATPGSVTIHDLQSRNGVFVNGSPVNERALADGDRIRIGDSALVVILPAQGPEAASNVGVNVDDTAVVVSTVSMEAARARYTDQATAAARHHTAVAGLELLLRLSDALHSAPTLGAVYDTALAHALEATAATAAAIVERSDDDQWNLEASLPSGTPAPTINRAVGNRALAEEAAFMTESAAMLCAPLGSATVLWVMRGTPPFSDQDLQLLAAIGSITALAIERVAHLQWLQDENARLHQAAIAHELVGESHGMQAIQTFIRRVAVTDATVLLQGESGTGKELIAKAIHANSARAGGPFVAINCAALPEALLESELFGHERGAFTGALAQQRGRLEMANGGTVFLDEIGELAPPLQAKLLRVLEQRVVDRVGGRKSVKIDVRVVTATNRDLEAAMTGGHFRPDLFYRLNVVAYEVPPLRERREDIPLLAAYFVRRHAARCKRLVRGIAPAARAILMRHDWPGNVRELSNALERAVVLGASDVITPDDLPESLLEASSDHDASRGFHSQIATTKREIIREALHRHGGNVAAAARELDLQVTYLHRLIRNLEIRAPKR
jgi:DNA-binding NtrC family response regulator/pSer/pThr/pTyr-binding forkhead associated (FHA) protein